MSTGFEPHIEAPRTDTTVTACATELPTPRDPLSPWAECGWRWVGGWGRSLHDGLGGGRLDAHFPCSRPVAAGHNAHDRKGGAATPRRQGTSVYAPPPHDCRPGLKGKRPNGSSRGGSGSSPNGSVNGSSNGSSQSAWSAFAERGFGTSLNRCSGCGVTEHLERLCAERFWHGHITAPVPERARVSRRVDARRDERREWLPSHVGHGLIRGQRVDPVGHAKAVCLVLGGHAPEKRRGAWAQRRGKAVRWGAGDGCMRGVGG
eukprot:scaffold3547_cov110-Isochrysis_galbana.AAC.3